MKTFALLLAPVLLAGCVRFEASQTFVDPDLKITVTNHVSGTFVFAKSAVESIEIAKKTKTTSALVGAKNAQTDGGVEFVKAIADSLGNAFAAGAKAAVMP